MQSNTGYIKEEDTIEIIPMKDYYIKQLEFVPKIKEDFPKNCLFILKPIDKY